MSTKKESTSEKLVKRDIEALRENDEQLASMKEEVSTKKEKCCEQMTCDCLPFSHLQSESIEWDEETFEDLWWGSFDNDGEKNSHEYDKMLSYVKDAITTAVANRELDVQAHMNESMNIWRANIIRQAVAALYKELAKKVEGLPNKYPDMESDDYDMGLQDMKRSVLSIIKH